MQGDARRGLIGWTAKQLAERARIGVMAVGRFEAGQGETHRAAGSVIRPAFAQAGVEFIDPDGGDPSVRPKENPA